MYAYARNNPLRYTDLARIIRDFTGEKRKDALKEVMNTGFWRTRWADSLRDARKTLDSAI
jgi:hypothetical protein